MTHHTPQAGPASGTRIHLMRVPEVEAEFGIPAATLRWYRHVGKGPRSSRLGTRIVYRREDVEAWITAQLDATAVGGVGEA